MFIISHRGAAGLAPENTLEGIAIAKKYGVHGIEVDARPTKDNNLVLCHDHTLLRKAGKLTKISDMALKEVQMTITGSGHPIPSLQEALEEAGKTPLLLDCKGNDWAEPLSEVLKTYPKNKSMVISDNHSELVRFSILSPDHETYASIWGHSLDALFVARQAKLTGISLSYGLYNPFTYKFAKRAGLKMIMSTINRPLFARFMHKFYPEAIIVTDFPDRFQKLISSKNK